MSLTSQSKNGGSLDLGDTVTIGMNGKVHWTILMIVGGYDDPWVQLESGMTERRRVERLSNLKLYRRRDGAANLSLAEGC